MQDPERRSHAGEDERRRVDPAHHLDRQSEERRVPPSAVAQRTDRETEHPSEGGPRQQDHRDPRGVVQRVRAERVRERCHHHSGAAPPERPAEVQDTRGRGEDDRAEPQALRDPVGHAETVEGPVEGPHREEVPDVLVRDRAHPDVRVPHRGGALHETAGVEVEVLLRVGGHLAAGRQQGRQEREGGQKGVPGAPVDPARRFGHLRHAGARRRTAWRASTSSVPTAVAPQVNLPACSIAPAPRRRRRSSSATTRAIASARSLRRVDEEARPALLHRVGVPRDPRDHGRGAAGGGLGDRHPPPLVRRRRRDDPRPAVQGDEVFVVEAAGQMDPALGAELAQPGLEASRARIPRRRSPPRASGAPP